jgi:hypothetical protein
MPAPAGILFSELLCIIVFPVIPGRYPLGIMGKYFKKIVDFYAV